MSPSLQICWRLPLVSSFSTTSDISNSLRGSGIFLLAAMVFNRPGSKVVRATWWGKKTKQNQKKTGQAGNRPAVPYGGRGRPLMEQSQYNIVLLISSQLLKIIPALNVFTFFILNLRREISKCTYKHYLELKHLCSTLHRQWNEHLQMTWWTFTNFTAACCLQITVQCKFPIT